MTGRNNVSMALSAILIDIDSTVYNAVPCYRNGLVTAQRAAARIHPDWESPDTFRADYENARDRLVARIGYQPAWHSRFIYFLSMLEKRLGNSSLRSAGQLRRAYWDGYAEKMAVDDDCAETIQWIRDRGITVVWTTNFTCEPQVWKLDQLGLIDAADYFVASEEAGVEKPDPALFSLALEKANTDPGEAWMVGDDLNRDIAGAQTSGLKGVWMCRNSASRNDIEPDHTIYQWTELKSLVERMATNHGGVVVNAVDTRPPT
jgi:HAD superfamily hydrolase (TIGR01549 family)